MTEPLPDLKNACQDEGARTESEWSRQMRLNNEQTKRDLRAGWRGFMQLTVEPPMRLFVLTLIWGIIIAACELTWM